MRRHLLQRLGKTFIPPHAFGLGSIGI
jgi:hypothetical protein